MTRHNQQTPNKRQTVYEQVTARIIQELEQGRVPWVQPWGDASGAPTAFYIFIVSQDIDNKKICLTNPVQTATLSTLPASPTH